MFDTIFIGTSGLLNHAKGLRVVGNNLANVNTPGFKSSQLQFSNLFEQGGGNLSQSGAEGDGHSNGNGVGNGVTSLGPRISFRAGLDQATGNPLDLNINGNGFYTIKRDDEILYTRAGDFRFDEKGFLVNGSGDHVMALDSGGKLVDIKNDDLDRSLPKATANVEFSGALSTTVLVPPIDHKITSMAVLDAAGVDHPLTLTFVNAGGGSYTVTATNAAGTVVASGTIKYVNAVAVAGSDSLSFSYAPAGVTAFPVKLNFAKTTLGTSNSLGVASQDGYALGVRTDQLIEADGSIKIMYSNGQSAKGQRLAMADFRSEESLQEAGGSAFRRTAGAQVHYGYAGVDTFGKLVAGHREGSNVDLAEEFGNLILMQRGYQAASHVVSTANDMIQQLFDMKGR